MAEINHLVGIRAPIGRIYTALSTTEGLSRWWTVDVRGSASVGGTIQFRFAEQGGPDMLVTELTPSSSVKWKCTAHTEKEWLGTEVGFALREEGGQTLLRFRHSGWKEASDFLAFCSTKWAIFLLSLKEYLETGAGRPFPYDRRAT